MRIIKKGDLTRLTGLRWYHAECPCCGCVFEFHWKEANHNYDFGACHSISCPTCNETIGLMSDHVNEIKH